MDGNYRDKKGDKYKDVDWLEQIRKFRGEDKIRAIRLEVKDGFYRLFFEEDAKTYFVDDKSRKVLDEILLEFGGKNEETVAAPAECLQFDGSWDSEFLLERGHRISSITISGLNRPTPAPEPIHLGAECGYSKIKDSQGVNRNTEIVINKRSGFVQTAGDLTVNFTTSEMFDNFIN
jgi:hypothetical protein